MDKSPAYENFLNKMASMQGQGKPKMSATTMRIGSGSIEKRITNNERKITILKNIFKARKRDIGENIKPSVNNVRESLLETNIILRDISEIVQKDYGDRIKILQDQIKDDTRKFQDQKRGDQESNLEKTKRVNKIGKKVSATLAKPFVGLFDQLKELGVILGTGLIANNVIKFVTDPKNAEKVEKIFSFIKNNAGTILSVGGLLVGITALGGLKTIYGLAIGLAKFFTTGLGVLLLPLMLGGSSKQGKNLQKNTNLSQNFNEFLDKEDRDKRFAGIFVTDRGPFSEFESAFYNRPEITSVTEKAVKLLQENKISKDDYDKVFLALKRVMIDEFIRNFEGGKYLEKEGIDQFLLENSTLPKFQFGGFSHGLGIVEPGEFVFKKSVVDKIGLAKLYATNSGMNLSESNIFVEDLEPMYMNMGESKVSNVPATQVLRVSSSNVNNNYMKETPSLFGFTDLVYT